MKTQELGVLGLGCAAMCCQHAGPRSTFPLHVERCFIYHSGQIYPGNSSHRGHDFEPTTFFKNTWTAIARIESEWSECYTRVRIHAPANTFTNDLVFEHGASPNTEWKICHATELVQSYYSYRDEPWMFLLFLWLFSFCIAPFIGMIGFGHDPRIVRALVVFGICHAVSFVLDVIVAAVYLNCTKRFEKFTFLRRTAFGFGFPALAGGVMLACVVLPFVPLL